MSVSVPNTFLAATDAVAAEVNANFDSLVQYINNNVVWTNGERPITGTQTISSLVVSNTLTVNGNLDVDADITGQIVASNGTSVVLDNGTNGSDATFKGDVLDASSTVIVDVSAATFNGNATTSSSTTGNAATASKWLTARTLTLSGDVTGNVSIDGDTNVTLTTTVGNDSHTHDTRYYTETESDARFLRSDADDTMVGRLSIDNDDSEANSWSLYLSGDHGTASATVGFGSATLVVSDEGNYPSVSWRSTNLGYAAVMRLSTAAANKLVLRNAADSGWGDLQLGTLTQSSDLTLKTKTGEVPGLDFVGRLSPFKGHWTGSEENVNFWLGAQEVSSALAAAGFDANACTLVDSSEDLMGLQYTQLIPVLVKAVQELTARLEAVEAA